ncbi:MAG: glycosyltransferase family 9 protein [Elusimicrobia bacterium]|nr:glycosyltransferase family 9 protein [Elusimicrobiota bacterium]
MDSLIFFHMNQLGDLLFSLPVLAAARKQWPEKRILSVVRPALGPLLTASGLVDGVVVRHPAGGIAALRFVAHLSKERAQTGVFFSESPGSIITAVAAGISQRIGFDTASLRLLLTDTAARTGVPSLKNNKNLGIKIGLTAIADDYAGLITVPAAENVEALRWLGEQSFSPDRVVLLSPGASRRRQDKCWDVSRWTELANRIIGGGLHPILIGAPQEREALSRIARLCSAALPVFCAENGILSLAALMRLSRVFIGIDSGAMHLAASGGTPVIALFAVTDPAQVGPRPASRHQIIKRDAMDAITVEDVCNALKNIQVL